MGGGPGCGEILRPGQSRPLEVATGAANQRPAGPPLDPALAASGADDGRSGEPARGGNSTRRTALTVVVKHPAR